MCMLKPLVILIGKNGVKSMPATGATLDFGTAINELAELLSIASRAVQRVAEPEESARGDEARRLIHETIQIAERLQAISQELLRLR